MRNRRQGRRRRTGIEQSKCDQGAAGQEDTRGYSTIWEGVHAGTVRNRTGMLKGYDAQSGDQVLMSSMNSARVRALSLNPPRMADVTIEEPCF